LPTPCAIESAKRKYNITLQQRCLPVPVVMEQETELCNGAPCGDGVETITMTATGMLEPEAPAKVPVLRMHRLRNLAIASIICGCSCTGVLALIYAVKVSNVLLSWEGAREKFHLLPPSVSPEALHPMRCASLLTSLSPIQASEKQKAGFHDSALFWSKKSRRMSWLSICVWVSLLIMVPLLVMLTSYIISQAE
ncbi:hypothetical protein lerEdw1_009243, partial [Lerista edwardsae]